MATRIWIRLIEAFLPAIIAVAILLARQADRRDRAQLAAQLASAQQTIAQASTNQKDRDAQLTQTLAQLAAQKQSNLSTAQLLQALPQALRLPQPIALQTVSPPDQAARPGTSENVGAGFSPSPGAAHTANSLLSDDVNPAPTGAPHQLSHAGEIRNSKGNYAPSESVPATNNPAKSAINTPLPKSSPQNSAPNAVIPSTDLQPLYNFALDCQACQAKLSAAQSDLADEKTKSAALTKERDAALRAAKGGSLLRRIARAAKWFAIGAAAGAVAAKATR